MKKRKKRLRRGMNNGDAERGYEEGKSGKEMWRRKEYRKREGYEVI